MCPKHLNRPLVVGYSMGPKLFPLNSIREDIGQIKKSKYTSNHLLPKITSVILDHSYHAIHVLILLLSNNITYAKLVALIFYTCTCTIHLYGCLNLLCLC